MTFKLASARCALLGLLLLFAGCASTANQNVAPRTKLVDVPPIGEVHTIEVGDSVVQKARVMTYDARLLRTEFNYVGTGINVGYRLTLQPGYYVKKKEDKRYDYYIAIDNAMVKGCGLGICPNTSGGFMIPQVGGSVRAFQDQNTPIKVDAPPDWEETVYAAVDQQSFRQELLYNGRSGSTVRFLYREFIGDMIRPAFSQDLSYELDEGDEIGFRGVRVQILEASNTALRYRVLHSFPDTK